MSPVPEQVSQLSKCCKQDGVYATARNAIVVSKYIQYTVPF